MNSPQSSSSSGSDSDTDERYDDVADDFGARPRNIKISEFQSNAFGNQLPYNLTEDSRTANVVSSFWDQASSSNNNTNDNSPRLKAPDPQDIGSSRKSRGKTASSSKRSSSIVLNVHPSLMKRLSKNYHPNLIMQNNAFESTAGRMAREKRER